MANSNTYMSRQTRMETSKEWNKVNAKRVTFNFNLNNSLDIEILEFLEKMEGTQIDKVRKVFSFYMKNNKKTTKQV